MASFSLLGCPGIAAARTVVGGLLDRLIARVLHPGMAPVGPRHAVGNLPVELTSFVGRRREISEAKALLSRSRLLTLTGMGGVGKTRLAQRVAAELHRAFPDGAWRVELAELSEPALLVPTIAAALGLSEQNRQWNITTLQEQLQDRRMLLLLDNCEHLIDACALVADALLTACPDLRLLATSREPLGIGGEQSYPVRPLAVPYRAYLKQLFACESI